MQPQLLSGIILYYLDLGWHQDRFMLQLKQITMQWQNQKMPPLLSDFSLTIEAGKITVLQGPSGCGKSTLLSAIAGTSPAALSLSGDIILNGTDLTALPPEQRQIGILFQEALLFPHLTVGDNLAFGIPPSISRADRKKAISSALAQADMADYENADPAILSGGQKARIAMMRAMLSEPKLLLMDESFAALDPELRQQFGHFVSAQIEMRQIPALLISHHEDDRRFATGAVVKWPS